MVSITEKPLDSSKDFSVRFQLERETGIEPATLCLGSKCSTTELLPLVVLRICRGAARVNAVGGCVVVLWFTILSLSSWQWIEKYVPLSCVVAGFWHRTSPV